MRIRSLSAIAIAAALCGCVDGSSDKSVDPPATEGPRVIDGAAISLSLLNDVSDPIDTTAVLLGAGCTGTWECNPTAPCPNGYRCQTGRCERICSEDSDCGPGEYCQTQQLQQTKWCQRECKGGDSDCALCGCVDSSGATQGYTQICTGGGVACICDRSASGVE
jgi:hypothetical protein